MENKELMAECIRNIRKHLGMKQKEFAQRLDISSAYMSDIEAGKKNPGIDVLEKMHKTFNVNPSYLFTGEGNLFLTSNEKKKKEPETFESKGLSDEMTMTRELVWYVMNIPVVRYAMLEAFRSYLHEKGDMVDEDVKKFLAANKGEKRP